MCFVIWSTVWPHKSRPNGKRIQRDANFITVFVISFWVIQFATIYLDTIEIEIGSSIHIFLSLFLLLQRMNGKRVVSAQTEYISRLFLDDSPLILADITIATRNSLREYADENPTVFNIQLTISNLIGKRWNQIKLNQMKSTSSVVMVMNPLSDLFLFRFFLAFFYHIGIKQTKIHFVEIHRISRFSFLLRRHSWRVMIFIWSYGEIHIW